MTLAWLFVRPFAHRGLHGPQTGQVENSLGAFQAAIADGFGIELDVQLTADGRAVVFHDDDLMRLCGRPERVRDLPLAALEQIPLSGSTDCIAGLDQVLKLIAGRAPILVEIKSKPAATGPLEQAVARTLGLYRGDVAVMSFNPQSLAWFRRHRPDIVRGLVASTRYRRELGWRLSHAGGHQRAALEVAPDFIAYDIRSLPNTFTRACRNDGIPVLTWTVRTAKQRAKATAHTDNIIFELT